MGFLRGLGGVALALLANRSGAQQPELPAAQSSFATAVALKMRAHPYLARNAFDVVESHPPYLFFVQRPTDPAAPKAGEVAAATVPLLEPARERFERDVAKPLRLEQRKDIPALVVIVLGSHDAFEECYRATSGAWHFDTHATFARDVGAAVLYDDKKEAREAGEPARSAAHALVHALQVAYYALPESAPVRSWLFEGMADTFARPEGGDSFPAPERLAQFVLDAKAPDTRWAHLRTFEEMCAVDEPLHLEEFFQQRTRDQSLLPGPDQDPWTAFYREATLLYAFLSGDDGKHRAGLAKWLGRAFAGSRNADSMAASFGTKSLDELDEALLAWIQREYKRAYPAEKLKPEVVLGALSRKDLEAPAPGAETAARPAAPAGTSASGAAKPAPVPRPPVPVSTHALTPLTIADASPDEKFAWAISEIGAGRLRAGRARLAELLTSPEPAFVARVEREEQRAAAWEAARDAFLTRLVSDKSTLELDLGARVTAREFGVRSYSEGLVELDDKKGGIRRVPVESLDPLALARGMRAETAEGGWARFYLFVLRGDERWKKLLKPEGEEAGALLADAKEDYPARLKLGQAMAKISSIAERPMPTTPKEADQRALVFKSLLGDLKDTSIVTRKRAQLRAHAQALYEKRFELQGGPAALAGKLETLNEGRVRITYAFDDPHELDDFSLEPYPVLASRALGTTKAKDVPFQVSRGTLIALGQASMRTLYDLETPLTVKWDLQYEEAEVDRMAFFLALGICDDGVEHFVWAVNLNSLQLLDSTGSASSPDADSSFTLGRAYALELRHDGRLARLLCDGKESASLDAEARQFGAVFLRASSDLGMRVQKLVIEGHLRADSFERMKRTWAARQLAGL